jgi:hypothetical protein
MQQDMHFYALYSLARAAGISDTVADLEGISWAMT